jgi:hypothetical protein
MTDGPTFKKCPSYFIPYLHSRLPLGFLDSFYRSTHLLFHLFYFLLNFKEEQARDVWHMDVSPASPLKPLVIFLFQTGAVNPKFLLYQYSPSTRGAGGHAHTHPHIPHPRQPSSQYPNRQGPGPGLYVVTIPCSAMPSTIHLHPLHHSTFTDYPTTLRPTHLCTVSTPRSQYCCLFTFSGDYYPHPSLIPEHLQNPRTCHPVDLTTIAKPHHGLIDFV